MGRGLTTCASAFDFGSTVETPALVGFLWGAERPLRRFDLRQDRLAAIDFGFHGKRLTRKSRQLAALSHRYSTEAHPSFPSDRQHSDLR